MPRRYAPTDGSWFLTSISLGRLVREFSKEGIESDINEVAGASRIPIWVSLVARQDDGILRPLVRIASMDSPCVEPNRESCYAVGLFRDSSTLEGTPWGQTAWQYIPLDPTTDKNHDTTAFACDKCKQTLYRDDRGRRWSNSACLSPDGERICRTCEASGPIYHFETEAHIEKMKRLADRIGGECKERFDRDLDRLMCMLGSKDPRCQIQIYRDSPFSLHWQLVYGGERGMNGGLILHSYPVTDIKEYAGEFEFLVYDREKKEDRPATEEEISKMSWGIHT